eukprot:4331294-Ditylum_brightwellii.AAC.1
MEKPKVEPTDKPAQSDKPKDEPKKSMIETTEERIYEMKNEPNKPQSKSITKLQNESGQKECM